LAFPTVAAFVRDTNSWPKWWDVLDVTVAFVLALLAIVVPGLAQSKVHKPAEDAGYRAYRALAHGLLAALVVFFLAGDRVVWANYLAGFAGRAWLLAYGLTAWFTALGPVASR
jgi:hypothetical protein